MNLEKTWFNFTYVAVRVGALLATIMAIELPDRTYASTAFLLCALGFAVEPFLKKRILKVQEIVVPNRKVVHVSVVVGLIIFVAYMVTVVIRAVTG